MTKKVLTGIALVLILLVMAACSPDQYKEVTITLPVCAEPNANSFNRTGGVNAYHSTWQMTKMYGNADSVVVTLKCVGRLVSAEN